MIMALPKLKPATYADIEALPEHMVGEIAFGTLHAHPRPSGAHGFASNALGFEVTGPFQFGRGGPGGWVFITEPELHLGDHVIVPDIGGWRDDRMPSMPKTPWFDVAPDWVCEVLSPSTRRFDRTDKLTIYATHCVDHCWYVDPLERTLEVFERQGDKWLLAATCKDDDPVCAPPFGGFSFALDDLWHGSKG